MISHIHLFIFSVVDMFFVASFIFVAFMLVVHSISYFWRSDDGLGEEEAKQQEEYEKKQRQLSMKPSLPYQATIDTNTNSNIRQRKSGEQEIEMTSSPSTTLTVGSSTERADHDLIKPYTNPAAYRDHEYWGLYGAWRKSSSWRKSDTIIVIILFVAYAIVVAVILGNMHIVDMIIWCVCVMMILYSVYVICVSYVLCDMCLICVV